MDDKLAYDYAATFATPYGKRVLSHLRSTIYDCVYEGNDPILLASHNARRSVVHEILFNIDVGEHPDRYVVETAVDTGDANG